MWGFELTLTRWRSLVERPLGQSNEGTKRPMKKKFNLKSHLKPGIRCMFISIAGLENVGKWDLSANIS